MAFYFFFQPFRHGVCFLLPLLPIKYPTKCEEESSIAHHAYWAPHPVKQQPMNQQKMQLLTKKKFRPS